MKTSTPSAIIYSLTFAAVAVWLLLDHRACAQIHQENMALLRRLNEATIKLAENPRWPERTGPATDQVSDASRAPSAASPPGADVELLRLRSEVAGLLAQHQQTESLRSFRFPPLRPSDFGLRVSPHRASAATQAYCAILCIAGLR